jgi:hypothetical protein
VLRLHPPHLETEIEQIWKISRSTLLRESIQNLNSPMRALSIRQPYAEQILRGTKRFEYRSRPTAIRGRVYIYASLKPGKAEEFDRMHVQPGDFPTGVLVGTVEITGCSGEPGDYKWHLAGPQRLQRHLRPTKHPQPAWFYPF